jgi:predicted transcriptional regulator
MWIEEEIMPSKGVKESVQAVIESLPEDVTWDEVQYRLYVRQKIEEGLADAEAGRIVDTEEMDRRLDPQKLCLKAGSPKR